MIQPFGLSVGAGLDVLDSAACLTRDAKAAFAAVYFGGASSESGFAWKRSAQLCTGTIQPFPSSRILGPFHQTYHQSCGLRMVWHSARRAQTWRHSPLPSSSAWDCCVASVGFLSATAVLNPRTQHCNFTKPWVHADLMCSSTPTTSAPLTISKPSCGIDFADSDVMVMLDTPGYFGSRWTAAEIGRALAKKIAVLGVVWPDHQPVRLSQLREPIFLQNTDLQGRDGPLTVPGRVERILSAVERLRSQGLAIRHAAIAGAPRLLPKKSDGFSRRHRRARRGMKIVLAVGRTLFCVSAVGVPTAEHFHEAAEHVKLVDVSTTVPAQISRL